GAPAAMDTPAPRRRGIVPAARQRRRQDAEIDGAEVSWRPLHDTKGLSAHRAGRSRTNQRQYVQHTSLTGLSKGAVAEPYRLEIRVMLPFGAKPIISDVSFRVAIGI